MGWPGRTDEVCAAGLSILNFRGAPMTNDLMNPDEIAAMFEAAKSGALPDATNATQRRSGRLRTVDFSRPTKFTSDHQRRISRAMDTFCVTAASRLTAEMRTSFELESINTSQVTWSAAQAQLPSQSLAATLEVNPIGTKILLTTEQSFALWGIECLLGGAPDRSPKERRFSEIDWSLSRRLIDTLVTQLSIVWQDLGGVTLKVGEIDIHNEASTIASVSEPTFVVMIECRMGQHSAALALMIPWVAIDPIADRIAGRERVEEGVLVESGMNQALSAAPVTLRAEVASVDLPISQILSLQPGDVIRLGARAEEGVLLFAENVRLARARPGANGARRAIQIRRSEDAAVPNGR
jgi:flagellar motor switch protein FliM